MRDCFLKIQFEGPYWKIATIINLAKTIGLDVIYFSGGTVRAKEKP